MPAERMLRAAIVDDEEPARILLREYLAAHPDIEIVAECSNGFEAVKAVQESNPELLFLDVQMPKLNGFEVLELIRPGPAVIFTTAYDQYALKAFEVHAVDYLLKPFSAERLAQSLALARDRMAKGQRQLAPEFLDDMRRQARSAERILIRDGSKVHVIPAQKIDYIESEDDYVSFHSGGKKFLKQTTLAALEEILDSRRFIRIHRSYILNVELLVRIEPYAKDSRIAILADGSRLPVSRAGYARLKPLM